MKFIMAAWEVLKREARIIVTDSTIRNVALIAPFLYALLFSFVYMLKNIKKT